MRARPRLVPLDVDALRAEVKAFEVKYGVPSERMLESVGAFPFGRETDDGRRWSVLYGRLCRVDGVDEKGSNAGV